MANCKFCEKPVKVTPVFHPECLEGKVQEVAETICDKYCKYPTMYGDDQDLMQTEECNYCSIIKLLEIVRLS